MEDCYNINNTTERIHTCRLYINLDYVVLNKYKNFFFYF